MNSTFEHYYDLKDMSICVPGKMTMQELIETTAKDGLTYPLHHTLNMSIVEHLQNFPYTSQSFAYGPHADNVLGMNIKINGKSIKIGGRTVKNCTGFDLVRFICGSRQDVIEVEDIILRLRPLKDIQLWYKLTGTKQSLVEFQKDTLHSSWSYETEALDFHIIDNQLSLYISYSCIKDHKGSYENHLKAKAVQFGFDIEPVKNRPILEKPSIRFKTTLSDLIPRAQSILEKCDGEAYGFCGNSYAQIIQHNQKIDLKTDQIEVMKLGGHLEAENLEGLSNPILKRLANNLFCELAKL